MGAVYQSDVARAVATRLDTAEAFGRAAVEAVLGEIEARLGAGDEVILRGFGTFHMKRVGAKRLRLPGGRIVEVAAGTCPAWRPAETLKSRLKAEGTERL